ncbi:TRAP transporter small permease [Halalkalibacter oceani]|uniref:TRAP transporter small permease n=1 Tax=Halalkalibacter oceani TaxID=1653776 RepID=UPI003395C07B
MSTIPFLKKAQSYVFGLTILFTVLLANYAVFNRYILKQSLPWSDELLRYMFVWIVFIGAAIVYKKDQLVDLTLVTDFAKGKFALLLDLLRHLLTFLFIVMISYQSFIIMRGQMSTGEISAAMEIPVWIMTAGLLIGGCLWAVFAIFKILAALRRVFTSYD